MHEQHAVHWRAGGQDPCSDPACHQRNDDRSEERHTTRHAAPVRRHNSDGRNPDAKRERHGQSSCEIEGRHVRDFNSRAQRVSLSNPCHRNHHARPGMASSPAVSVSHRASAARTSAIRKSAARITRRIPIFLRSAGSSGRGGGCHPERSRLMSILLAASANGTRLVALDDPVSPQIPITPHLPAARRLISYRDSSSRSCASA